MDIALPVLVGGLPAVGLLVYLWLRARQDAGGRAYFARCPRCGQKVRYSARRVGLASTCPQCGDRWTLPGGAEPAQSLEIREVYRLRRR